ncbi:hypothetical protein D3C75_1276800 [compost metagenome]
MPSVLTLPWPAAGWDRMMTVKGVLPESLSNTFNVSVPPWLAAVSLVATGTGFGVTLTVTVPGSESRPLLSLAM